MPSKHMQHFPSADLMQSNTNHSQFLRDVEAALERAGEVARQLELIGCNATIPRMRGPEERDDSVHRGRYVSDRIPTTFLGPAIWGDHVHSLPRPNNSRVSSPATSSSMTVNDRVTQSRSPVPISQVGTSEVKGNLVQAESLDLPTYSQRKRHHKIVKYFVSPPPKDEWLNYAHVNVLDENGKDREWKCCVPVWDEKQHREDICYYYGTKRLVKRHVETVHFHYTPFGCNWCKNRYRHLKDLKIHVNAAHDIEVEKDKCPDCNELFVDPARLHRHRVAKHEYLPQHFVRKRDLLNVEN